MKPILPKGSGVPQVQGIFSSPRTTIILAPPSAAAVGASPLPMGTSFSNPLILPAPPTSTITLAAHRVPQPTPVMLPLTKSTMSPTNIQVQCPLLAPKNFPLRIELQQPTALYSSGKSFKRHPCKKNKERSDGRQSQIKYSNSETPILPKRCQSDPQTVILLPSAPGKAVTLPPSVLVPKCSLVIADEMHSQSVSKEGRENKRNDNKEVTKKLSGKVKKVNQVKFPQSNSDRLNKNVGNCSKTLGLKFLKKKSVDHQSIAEDETGKIKPLDIHEDDIREDSSLPIVESGNPLYVPESFILSAEGYLSQSGNFSHQQDVPHHPPPPYPQDSVVDISSGSKSTEAQQDPNQCQKEASRLAVNDSKSFHGKRKKCEWKHKRHSIMGRATNASSSVSVPEIRSDFSSKVTGEADSHITPLSSSPLSPECSGPCTTPSSSSDPSINIPLGKTCITDTVTVVSSCSSSASHSHSSPVKNRNITPSLCKLETNHKSPIFEQHISSPAPRSSLGDPQDILLIPGKSSQNKSFEQPYHLSTSSVGVCITDVPSSSSLPSELSPTQPASQTSYCSQSSVVTHLSHSPASSLTHETNTSFSSCNGATPYELKSGATALCSQAGLQLALNAQRTQSSVSSHLNECDQAPGSAFYFQSPQCSTSLHSVLPSHSSIPGSVTNSDSTASCPYIPSEDQAFIHKVSSHPSSYADSTQSSSFAQSLQPAPFMDPSHLNSYSQSSQPKLITKSPHSHYTSSHQLPSYTQSSSLSHTPSTQVVINTVADHSTSHAHSSSLVAHVQSSQSSRMEEPHPDPCLHTEHASYLQPTQPLSLCGESQHGKAVSNHHSPQEVSFPSEYTSSYPSPQGGSHSHPSHTPVSVENLPAIAMFKDNSQSPVLPLYAASHDVSASQCYADSSSIPYASQQTSIHDPHYYSLGRFKVSSSSSVDVSSSHFILEKSLNPPSYEAHIQNAASYITSESKEQVTQHSLQSGHHQTSPTNYSLSCQIVQNQGTQPLHEDAKKVACSSPSPLLSLTSSPRYAYSQQLTHEDPHIEHSIIADIAQGTYDYDIEEPSQTYLPPTAPDAQIALHAESQASSTVEYNASNNPSENHSTSIHITSNCVQNSDQSRMQSSQSRVLVYPLARQDSLYKNSDQDDLGLSSWTSNAQSAGHSENLRIEKLLFIPHSEQTCLYMKKESSKNLPGDPGLHLRKDVMLKKFWIEEDEPIAEEIVSSLANRLPAPQTPPSKQQKPRQMLCQICGKMLKGRNSLRCHLNSHHNIQPHSCPTCGKSFTNRSVLVEHLRIHSGETPYMCSLCNAAFKTRSGLLRHGSMHTTARPHECSMCSKKFKTKLVLQQHMKLHLTDVFTCSECGKTFERRKSLAVHKAFHHHKTQRFTCPYCSKGYHFRTLLNQHMQLHSNVQKHVCSVCGKAFVWRSGLAAHMKTHSTNRPKCDICDMRFASEKRLKSHYRQHSNPKPHQCKVCSRCFSHAYLLASHSLIHQENKEYVCQKCDIVFTNAKKFRKHLVTHKKEEPRICRLSGTVEAPKPVL
ncbi:uncharacterized protein LOC135105936 isoform X1 [Scylla paramamosain]|uniref:uncharacterized protein LOC135105936 isoform X1 n=1 Tax=Scylla paramamosain TaxID=85552 RepID=UPI003082C56C